MQGGGEGGGIRGRFRGIVGQADVCKAWLQGLAAGLGGEAPPGCPHGARSWLGNAGPSQGCSFPVPRGGQDGCARQKPFASLLWGQGTRLGRVGGEVGRGSCGLATERDNVGNVTANKLFRGVLSVSIAGGAEAMGAGVQTPGWRRGQLGWWCCLSPLSLESVAALG